MAPRTRPGLTEPRQIELSPETEARVRAGVEAIERGETVVLTRAEVESWAETGELPETWLESLVSRS
jgi:hypothetical protein